MPATKDVDQQVILVNEQDEEIGTAEKYLAHQRGLLHRAFSVFVFRYAAENQPELLLQQRAMSKYHSAGLWTNACCSHPQPGEDILLAAKRRLQEELGLNLPELKALGRFHYTAHFENGLTENELDHVFIGYYQGEKIAPNPAEVENIRWVSPTVLKEELRLKSDQFTVWFEQALKITLIHHPFGRLQR